MFRKGGSLERALLEQGTDISCLNEVRTQLNELRSSVAHTQSATTLTEGVLDGDDDDGFMARSQLYFLARDAIALHGMIEDTEDLPNWVSAKITAASEGIDSVRRYTEYKDVSGFGHDEVEPEVQAPVEMPVDIALPVQEEASFDGSASALDPKKIASNMMKSAKQQAARKAKGE